MAAPPTEGDTPRRGRLLPRLLLVLVSLSLGILGVEVVVRVVGFDPEISWDWYLRSSGGRVPDRDLILIPPKMLDDDLYEAPPGALRVLALGDSFTEGYPVSRADGYPAVLERVLRERGRTARVLNLGVGNTGTDQQLRLLESRGIPKFRPDVVVWTLYANDLDDNMRLAVYDIQEEGALVPLDATQHWLYRRQRLYRAIPAPNVLKRNSRMLWAWLRAWEAVNRGEDDVGPARLAWSEEKVALAVREAERLAELHGFRLLLVLITSQSIFLDRASPGNAESRWGVEMHQRLRTILTASGHTFLEPMWSPPLPEPPATRESPTFGVFADVSRDSSPLGARHYNEAGYRLLAERIAEELRSGD